MRTQQVQPSLSMVCMHSQQAWIISEHLASPLVQVTVTPSLVLSTLHRPMVRLQQQTPMPFIVRQQLHMPPASMLHRFCTMLTAILSSPAQVIFIPPVHFSIFTVQRGTIIQFVTGCIPSFATDTGAPEIGTPSPRVPLPMYPRIRIGENDAGD